jgi:hypothetical protein
MAHVGIGSRPFILGPSCRESNLIARKSLQTQVMAGTQLFCDPTRTTPRKICNSSPPVRGVCLFQCPPASARGYKWLDRVTSSSKMTARVLKIRRGGGLLVEPWIVPLPASRAGRLLSSGFLGGFAEDDSFLNHGHFAPEYFAENSLDWGFKRRLATRHDPLYHVSRRTA